MSESLGLPQLCKLPDPVWEKLHALIDADDPPKSTGRPKVDRRRVMEGILFRLQTGCQWNRLPRWFGDDSTVHRYFQNWIQNGLFEKLWALLTEECPELSTIDWRWRAPSVAIVEPAPMGRTA